MITSSKLEFVRTDDDGNKWWRVILTADAEPDSLELTGADVSDLASNVRFAAGSVLLTPSANYVAYVDGTFGEPTVKQGVLSFSITPELSPDPAFTTLVPLYYEDLTDEEKENGRTVTVETPVAYVGQTLTVTVTPTAAWYAADYDDNFSEQGQPISFTVEPAANDYPVDIVTTNTPDWEAEDLQVISLSVTLYYNGQH